LYERQRKFVLSDEPVGACEHVIESERIHIRFSPQSKYYFASINVIGTRAICCTTVSSRTVKRARTSQSDATCAPDRGLLNTAAPVSLRSLYQVSELMHSPVNTTTPAVEERGSVSGCSSTPWPQSIGMMSDDTLSSSESEEYLRHTVLGTA